MKRYEIESYTTEKGEVPFQKWLNNLKDAKAQTKVFTRLERAKFGHFGDFKSIKGAKGLFEMRERHGAGLRIYYSIVGDRVVLLLAGSTKRDQKRIITKAKEYLADYERGNNHD
ncbi:MAG: type II toxin-antitoxin system RelE/ParE family toxin [Alphaproteobacteria bacterium]|nr:type II toxin-antitoxin system RelE/ParE family toxin [Alphaproteobacteria bacterium]